MPTNKNSWVVKATNTVVEGVISVNGVAEAAGRSNVAIVVNPTISTEDHPVTITTN